MVLAGVHRWVIDTSLSVCQGTLRRPNTTCDQYQNTLPNIHLPSKCISCTAWLQAAVTQQDPTEPSATRRPKPTYSWQWGNHSPKRKLPLDTWSFYSALVAAVFVFRGMPAIFPSIKCVLILKHRDFWIVKNFRRIFHSKWHRRLEMQIALPYFWKFIPNPKFICIFVSARNTWLTLDQYWQGIDMKQAVACF